MKKILLLLFVLFLQNTYAALDYNQLNTDVSYCDKIKTSQCFLNLVNKYTMANSYTRNVLYYYYASALMLEKEYGKAKDAFKTVLFREKNNKELIKLANQNIAKINEIYNEMANANNIDTGNYYDSNKEYYYWQNPYNIKVFISSNTGKEEIFKKAFSLWDERLFKSVNFSYVNDANKADIIIKYVDSIGSNKAGVTYFSQVYQIGKKTYMKKINIEVALNNPGGGRFTDANLLSTTLHEIGHGLGIRYHSENKNDIMYYNTETYKNGNISRRDVNTVKYIYRN